MNLAPLDSTLRGASLSYKNNIFLNLQLAHDSVKLLFLGNLK
jgi:hypothetical protein